MAYSYTNYLSDGVQTEYTFPFPYLDQTDIYVTLNGFPTSRTFLNESTIQLSEPAVAGVQVGIRRITNKDQAPADFVDGSNLLERDLDRLTLFALYTAQESSDLAFGLVTGSLPSEISRGELLDLLNGSLTLSEFALGLASEIALISGSAEVLGSVAWQVLQETIARATAIQDEAAARATGLLAEATARGAAITAESLLRQEVELSLTSNVETLTAALGDAAAAISVEREARITADSALASQIESIAAGTSDGALALVTAETIARVDADGVLASSITALQATVTTEDLALGARITTEETARISADGAAASRISVLEAIASDPLGPQPLLVARITAVESAIVTETAARATQLGLVQTAYQTADAAITANLASLGAATSTADTALANRADALEAKVDLTTGQTVLGLIATEATARANADSATSTLVTSVQSSVTTMNGRLGAAETDLAAVETKANTSATALGVVNANYTLKTQATSGGKRAIAAIGLNSTSTGTLTQSEIILMADRTLFVSSPSGINDTPVALLQSGLVNGVNTLTIPGTRLGDQSIGARVVIDGSLTASKIDTRGLTIKDTGGNVIFSSTQSLDFSRVGGTGKPAANATVGATWNTNISGQPTTASILNSNVRLNANGTLTGGSGSSVPILVASLSDSGALATIDQITAANASTYIASAAIDIANIKLASIANLAALSALLGNVRISSTGSLIMGMSSYGVGIGAFMGYTGGYYKLLVGNKAAGEYMEWDGLTLKIKGKLTADAIDAVDTINLQGESVTIPRFAFSNSYIATVTIEIPPTKGGARVAIIGSVAVPRPGYNQRIDVDGTQVRFENVTGGTVPALNHSMILSSGTHTISVINEDTAQGTRAFVYVLYTMK